MARTTPTAPRELASKVERNDASTRSARGMAALCRKEKNDTLNISLSMDFSLSVFKLELDANSKSFPVRLGRQFFRFQDFPELIKDNDGSKNLEKTANVTSRVRSPEKNMIMLEIARAR